MREGRTDIPGYAGALVALAQAADALPLIEEDFARALEIMRKHGDIARFMRDPAVTPQGRSAALREILADAVHPVLLNFLVILVEQDLFRHTEAVGEAFFAAASHLRSKVSGEILSACPLSDETVEAIAQEIGRILGQEVHLRVRIDDRILAGLRVRVGDLVIDGTVDRFLQDARVALSG